MTFNHIWQTIRGEWQYPWDKHLFLQKKRNKPVVTLHTVLDFWWGIISEQQWIKIHTTLRIDGNHFLSGTCIQFNSTPSRMNLFIQEAELLNRLLSNKYIYDCHLSNWQVTNYSEFENDLVKQNKNDFFCFWTKGHFSGGTGFFKV